MCLTRFITIEAIFLELSPLLTYFFSSFFISSGIYFRFQLQNICLLLKPMSYAIRFLSPAPAFPELSEI
jgi:hypothetical protein